MRANELKRNNVLDKTLVDIVGKRQTEGKKAKRDGVKETGYKKHKEGDRGIKDYIQTGIQTNIETVTWTDTESYTTLSESSNRTS